MRTRAQHILHEMNMTGIAPFEEASISALHTTVSRHLAQHLRSKHDLHKHIQDHEQMMGKIRDELPVEKRPMARRLLRHNTIGQMAAHIHDKREKSGKSPTTGQSFRTAKRAFTGHVTGTRLVMPNTPGQAWTS